MKIPGSIAKASEGTEKFALTKSAEQIDAFDDVDIITGYGDDTGELLKAISKDPLLSKIPAVERGSTYLLPGSSPLATAANPTPLSIGYVLDATPPPSPRPRTRSSDRFRRPAPAGRHRGPASGGRSHALAPRRRPGAGRRHGGVGRVRLARRTVGRRPGGARRCRRDPGAGGGDEADPPYGPRGRHRRRARPRRGDAGRDP
ncbi:hypothetical protein SVIOM74S_10309 [Streptomyces violarus]